jgi:hypothetical protein
MKKVNRSLAWQKKLKPSDTLIISQNKIDSLKNRANSLARVDSIWLANKNLRKIDSLKIIYRTKIDSIQGIGSQKSREIQYRVDSLTKSYEHKAQELLSDFRLSKDVDLDPTLDLEISQQARLEIPTLNERLPEINSLGIQNSAKGLNLDQLNMTSPGDPIRALNEKLINPENPLSEVQVVTNEVKDYRNEMETLKAEGLQNSEKLPELAEQTLTKKADIQQLRAKQAELEKLKKAQQEYISKMEQYRNPDRLKQEATEKVKNVANDELSAQAEKLSAAQKKLAKAKKKHDSFENINQLPRTPKNPLANRPLYERIFPGFTAQISRPEMTAIDFAPQGYYRLRPHWDVGAGFIHRINADFNQWSFHQKYKMSGPKVFVSYRLFKLFYLRGDAEIIKYSVRQLPQTQEVLPREWTTHYLAGIGKEFRLNRKISGQTLAYYNLGHRENGPYNSKFLLRIGFDLSLHKDQRREFMRGLATPRKKLNTPAIPVD